MTPLLAFTTGCGVTMLGILVIALIRDLRCQHLDRIRATRGHIACVICLECHRIILSRRDPGYDDELPPIGIRPVPWRRWGHLQTQPAGHKLYECPRVVTGTLVAGDTSVPSLHPIGLILSSRWRYKK